MQVSLGEIGSQPYLPAPPVSHSSTFSLLDKQTNLTQQQPYVDFPWTSYHTIFCCANVLRTQGTPAPTNRLVLYPDPRTRSFRP